MRMSKEDFIKKNHSIESQERIRKMTEELFKEVEEREDESETQTEHQD